MCVKLCKSNEKLVPFAFAYHLFFSHVLYYQFSTGWSHRRHMFDRIWTNVWMWLEYHLKSSCSLLSCMYVFMYGQYNYAVWYGLNVMFGFCWCMCLCVCVCVFRLFSMYVTHLFFLYCAQSNESIDAMKLVMKEKWEKRICGVCTLLAQLSSMYECGKRQPTLV